MKAFTRADRVGEQIQRAVAALLMKDLKDPRLATATITGVKMTRDLRIARVYFATAAGSSEANEAALKGFESASGYIRRTLAGELGLRYMPNLFFHYDTSFDYAERIDSILRTLDSHAESDRRPSETK